MANPVLTRAEAAQRSALLAVDAYRVDLDLIGSAETFASTTTVTFTARTEGTDTWIDLVAPEVVAAELNGVALDLSGYNGQRLAVPGLAEANTLIVTANCAYSRTGEGLHRLIDPVDEQTYLYTQFETADAQRMYACFDQPDLKATFALTVTAPEHWAVVSNSPTPEPSPVSAGVARWEFAATPRISTYITALVAGPYRAVRDEYVGPHGRCALAVFARASMAEHLDAERVLADTKAGFAYFEGAFGHPYPFDKYDQLFVPEFNAGAMENAGCVTITEDLLFRSRVTDAAYEQRTNTILHELAHMWFGNLVTMRWWDDLWLNESFAEWASHYAMAHSSTHRGAWTTFTNQRKTWAYRQDQLPSTHPIAADMSDLEAVRLNFDGITYTKGASALRQLVAWVGEEEFLAGLRAYFDAYAWGNTDLRDLLSELETTSGRDLSGWTQEWLRTSGVNLLRPDVSVGHDGTIERVVIQQEPPAAPEGLPPVLRSHRLRVGCYDLVEGHLIRTHQVELDVVGAETEVPGLSGRAVPDLLLVNDDDLTFAKVRLDARSLATAVAHLGALTDPLARALLWGAAWDMTRDAELGCGEYLDLALAGLATESDIGAVQRVLLQVRLAIDGFAVPGNREVYLLRFSDGLLTMLDSAQAGSDRQLALVRALAGVARTDPALTLIADLLDGSATLPGLVVDTDLRWALLGRLIAVGRAGEDEIAAELARDDTATGRRQATALRTYPPTAAAKERAWHSAITDESLPNALLESTMAGLLLADHRDLLVAFRERYFEVVADVWASRSAEMGTMIAAWLYPSMHVDTTTIDLTDQFLARTDLPPGLRRVVVEGRDGVIRALRAHARDADQGPPVDAGSS